MSLQNFGKALRNAWVPIVVVGIPTAIACAYYGVIATPRYVSEAKFVVRSQESSAPNALGLALQGVGLSASTTDAFVVHEYMKSRDAFSDLSKKLNVEDIYVSRKSDPFSRAIKPWQVRAEETLYNGVQQYLEVGYDARNGISVLRVEAFSPGDAVAVNQELLDQSEKFINQMNDRSAARALVEAQANVDIAKAALETTQASVTEFRNSNGFVDPKFISAISGEVLSSLKVKEAEVVAEIAALRSSAPQSPMLAQLTATLNGIRAEILSEEAKLSGGASTFAPLLGRYEALIANLERAERTYTESVLTLETARRNQGKQKLFLEKISSPSRLDVSTEPKRLRGILTVLLTSLLIYSVIWLVWTGVREHKQG